MKNRSKWAKRCSVCGKVLASHNKSLLCFKHAPKEWGKNYRARPEIKQKIKKYQKDYRSRPAVIEKSKDYQVSYYKKNREKIIEYAKGYYKAHKKEIKEYFNKNRDKINLQRKNAVGVYNQRPEVKERKRAYMRKYRKRKKEQNEK